MKLQQEPTGIVRFYCTHCGKGIRIPPSGLGPKVPCPHCASLVRSPHRSFNQFEPIRPDAEPETARMARPAMSTSWVGGILTVVVTLIIVGAAYRYGLHRFNTVSYDQPQPLPLSRPPAAGWTGPGLPPSSSWTPAVRIPTPTPYQRSPAGTINRTPVAVRPSVYPTPTPSPVLVQPSAKPDPRARIISRRTDPKDPDTTIIIYDDGTIVRETVRSIQR